MKSIYIFFKKAFGRLKREIKKFYIKKTTKRRKRLLVRDDFTIISNNCWAGDLYRYFGLPYSSPTVGLYFFADEYIKFISNLKHYLGCELKQIKLEESKYKEEIIRKKEEEKLIARLDDVELVLLHYNDWKEAKEKWERRSARVNFDNLIVKFSRQNLCNEKNISEFSNLKFSKKIFFNNIPSEYDFSVYLPGNENSESIGNDIENYRRYVDIISFVNDGIVKRK